MISTASITSYLHALNLNALVTEDDKTVKITGAASGKTYDIVLDKYEDTGKKDEKGQPVLIEKNYGMQDLNQMVLREQAKLQPVEEDEGKIAEHDEEKDKLRAKGVPQPGAKVSDDGKTAFATPKNEETKNTPAQAPEQKGS